MTDTAKVAGSARAPWERSAADEQVLMTTKYEQRRLNFETYVRGLVLVVVVLALVGFPFWALISGTFKGASVTEISAPVSGITGAIIGYWFGQSTSRIERAAARKEKLPPASQNGVKPPPTE